MDKLENLLKRSNASIPEAHVEILERLNQIETSEILDRNSIDLLFKDGYLPGENGFFRFEDGTT